MSSDIHTRLLAFLASALAREGTEMAMRIEVEYKPRDGYRREMLKKWTREADPEIFAAGSAKTDANAEGDATLSGMAFVEALTSDIIDTAENHADSMGHGRHRFMVRVVQHYGERLTHSFAVLPAMDSDDNADEVALVGVGASGAGAGKAELAPTATGLVSQLMRHLEQRDRTQKDLMETMMRAVGHQATLLREENTELRQQLAEKDRERMDWMRQVEEAKSVEHDRQIEAQTVVAREERKTLLTRKTAALLPVVVSRMVTPNGPVGGDGDGGKRGEQSEIAKLLQGLLMNLTPEQRGALMTTLAMEQQAVLMEVGRVLQTAGDSPLIATMIYDFAHTLSPAQLTAILTALTEEQRGVFVRVLQLAQPSGSQRPPTPKPDAAHVVTKEN